MKKQKEFSALQVWNSMQKGNGSISSTAKELHISNSDTYRIMAKYGFFEAKKRAKYEKQLKVGK